jgi:predicted nucleic acid-binding protein
MQWCDQKIIEGFYSHKVVQEVTKNINDLSIDSEIKRWSYIQNNNVLNLLITPSEEEVAKAENIIRPKDAEILAIAKSTNVITHLITLDIRDFKTENVMQYAKPMHIVTPKEFIEEHPQFRNA